MLTYFSISFLRWCSLSLLPSIFEVEQSVICISSQVNFLPLETPSINLRKRINSSWNLSTPDSHFPQTRVTLSQYQEWLQRSRNQRPEKERSLVKKKTTTTGPGCCNSVLIEEGTVPACDVVILSSWVISCEEALFLLLPHTPCSLWHKGGRPPAMGMKLHSCDRSSGSAFVVLLPTCFFPWAPCQCNCSSVMWYCHC